MQSETQAKCGAARKIQRNWRKWAVSATTQIYIDQNGLTEDKLIMELKSFEDVKEYVRLPETVKAMTRLLRRIHILCVSRHGNSTNAQNVNVRVFLASFMVVYYPGEVFERMGVNERALLKSGGLMLESFFRILRYLNGSRFAEVPKEVTAGFCGLLNDYLECFKAWQTPDLAKLLPRIRFGLVALYQSEIALSKVQPYTSRMRVYVRNQIQRLRYKLSNLGGASSLEQFDEENVALVSSVAMDGEVEEMEEEEWAIPSAESMEIEACEVVVHEKNLDPTCQFSMEYRYGILGSIRSNFTQTCWDSLVQDLKLPCYARVLDVLSDIRSKIQRMAGEDVNVGFLLEAMDIDFIQEQTERGIYSWESSVKLIHAIMEAIRRVLRVKEVQWGEMRKELEGCPERTEDQAVVFCKALRFCMQLVHEMEKASVMGVIEESTKDCSGVEYERKKFAERVAKGLTCVEVTRGWIQKAAKEGGQLATVHNRAMVSLVMDEEAGPFPETLYFDVKRLRDMRMTVDKISQVASMLATLLDCVKQVPSATMEQFAERLMVEEEKVVVERMVEEAVEMVGGVKADRKEEEWKAKLRRNLKESSRRKNPIKRLMQSRMKRMVMELMETGNAENRLGSAVLFPRIKAIAAKLQRVAEVNRAVHMPTYVELFESCVEK